MTINSRNNHVFKGHRALLGSRFVTYGEVELQTRYEILDKSKTLDWGNLSNGAKQLAFTMLCQLTNKDFAEENYENFTNEVIISLNSRDWVLSGIDVVSWIKNNAEVEEETAPLLNKQKSAKKQKRNVVKTVCNKLQITQKNLAQILEVPEGTVSSWAVKNEIPRLGKKAIEFYIDKQKNQQIVDSYKNFVNLLNAS